jgi:hypothetical protein
METLRAALLGCLLTGGVLFGARPSAPERRSLRETPRVAGPGHLGLSAAELARWVRPLVAPVTLADLRLNGVPSDPAIRAAPLESSRPAQRRRCAAGRLRRRARF